MKIDVDYPILMQNKSWFYGGKGIIFNRNGENFTQLKVKDEKFASLWNATS